MIEYENLYKLNQNLIEEYKESFNQTLNSGWFVLGKNVTEFEQNFTSYCKTNYCVGVASGLDALILPLAAKKFEKGKEVIVPSNTYIATILAIVHLGLKPILVEPDINTYNIDPNLIEEKINKNTVAIMPVHLYGKCCEMDKIINIAQKHNLIVIEDTAQAHGAKYKGQMAGTFGDFGAFSFYPTKNLGALGDAGAITCKTEDNFKAMKMLRNYGSEVKYYNEKIGYNSRLDEIQAGFLNIKLKRLDDINNHKRKLAKLYLENINDNFIKPSVNTDYYDVYHIFNIRHSERDKLKDYLLKNNIKTEIHYPVAPNKQKAMRGIIDEIETPIAETIHNTTLSLPISYFHTEDEISKVIDVLNKF